MPSASESIEERRICPSYGGRPEATSASLRNTVFPMMWKRAEGTRPGRSLTTLRYLRRRLLRPSSTASSSGLPSPNPCHSNCEVPYIWRAAASSVHDHCEYPPRSASRPLRERNRHTEA